MVQQCAFCASLSESGTRPTRAGRPDKSGKVNFGGTSRTKAELEEAASIGCTRCRLILDGVQKYTASLGPEWKSFVVHDHVKMRENGNAMGVQIVPVSTTGCTKVLDLVFHVTSLRGIPSEDCHSGLEVFDKSWLTTQHWQPVHMPLFMAASLTLPITNPGNMMPSIKEGGSGKPAFECSDSLEVFECIQAWLETCDSEHEACRARDNHHVPLPTRLLDVSTDVVRLIEPPKDQQGTYVCLSHCWGGYQPIRTLQENLEQHKTIISWQSLPRTFQDAVTISRRLGLRYLWIDSLCIIQDSSDDWQREAARMADIYSQARFTIAALAAHTSKEGCFPESMGKYRAYPLAVVDFEGKPASVYMRQDHGHPGGSFMSQNTVLERGPAQPLLDRAWVFQERNLSPRVVYFGKTEVFWECSTAGYCGCRPGVRRDPDRPANIQTKPWAQWQLTVNAYRSLALTMDKDTFPALSGLATAFQREHGDLGRYLAGHWEAHLPRCLAWTTRERRSLGTNWRAPSWSWASVPSVWYDLREVEPACSVVTVECQQSGIDPHGELESAWIELSGRLFPGTLSRRKESPAYYDIDMNTTYGHGQFSGDRDFGELGTSGASIELSCLHLGVSKHKDPQKGNEDVFLALRPLQMETETYERVGLVSFNQLRGKIFPDGRLYSQKEVKIRIV